MTTSKSKRKKRSDSFLKGQLLVAMPLMTDRRFSRSVIYMCAHSDDGAMGLIINHRADHINFPDLLERLGITTGGAEDGISNEILERQVYAGGPVETGRGFVLHSSDYHSSESTLPIDDEVSLTASIEILKAIAAGEGPSHALLALGYAGWSAGQLESEIQANGWLHCPPDVNLLFDSDIDGKYTRALAKIGVDPSHLVSDTGHA
ncbi:YqgE/AlgH family protein [Hyphomicrobium sp.]|uniref:YqgE/AlgH family protein n=1 Tax=Hyphomicrobium sp. TaxID=82 RepID=UPI003F6ED2B7